jgi:hypothetical protein
MEKQRASLRLTALTANNRGAATAKDIRVEFEFDDPEKNWEFFTEHEIDFSPPTPSHPVYDTFSKMPYIVRKGDPNCEFSYENGKWHLVFEFGDLQPTRTMHPPAKFFVGARRSAQIQVHGRVMADGLRTGAACTLQLTAEVSSRHTNLDELDSRLDENRGESESR